jgi:hypothetical protein
MVVSQFHYVKWKPRQSGRQASFANVGILLFVLTASVLGAIHAKINDRWMIGWHLHTGIVNYLHSSAHLMVPHDLRVKDVAIFNSKPDVNSDLVAPHFHQRVQSNNVVSGLPGLSWPHYAGGLCVGSKKNAVFAFSAIGNSAASILTLTSDAAVIPTFSIGTKNQYSLITLSTTLGPLAKVLPKTNARFCCRDILSC